MRLNIFTFHTIATFRDFRNLKFVSRKQTRNRKDPRIGHLQEEDSMVQDERSAWIAKDIGWKPLTRMVTHGKLMDSLRELTISIRMIV